MAEELVRNLNIMNRLCAYNKGIDLAILFIPKEFDNPVLDLHCPKIGRQSVNIFDVMSKRICAILRDPLDRFLSANQYAFYISR